MQEAVHLSSESPNRVCGHCQEEKQIRETDSQNYSEQLGYVKRNLSHIQTLSQTVSLGVLKPYLYRVLLVILELYLQQKIMYDLKWKQIDDRIVSIWFPHVRPIKRDKTNA